MKIYNITYLYSIIISIEKQSFQENYFYIEKYCSLEKYGRKIENMFHVNEKLPSIIQKTKTSKLKNPQIKNFKK